MTTRPVAPRLLVPAACAAILLAACGSSPESQLKKADQALHAGDYGAALVNTRNVLAKDKTNAKAQLLLVRTLVQIGDLDSAMQQLDAAKTMNPPAAEVAELRARIALERGKPDALLTDIDGGQLALEPAAKEYYRARALQAMRRMPEALTGFMKLLADKPKDDELLVRAAECQLYLGRPALALEQVEAALAAKPDSAVAWLLKSTLLRAKGEAVESRSALDKVAKYAPGQLTLQQHVMMLGALVDSGLARGDQAAAANAQAGLVKAAPQALFTELAAARVQLAKGDSTGAVTALQTLLQKANDYQQVRVSLIAALLVKGNYELALHEVGTLRGANLQDARTKLVEDAIKAAVGAQEGSSERAIALANALGLLEHGYLGAPIIDAAFKAHGDSLPLAVAQARLLLAADRSTDALAKAEALIKDHAQDLSVLTLLADAQVASAKWADAIATFEKIWAQKPSPQVAVGLSQLRLRSKQGDATEPMQRWLEKNPKDIEVHTRLGQLLESQGNTAAAIAEYEKALVDAPRNFIALNNLAVLYRGKGDARALSMAKKAYDLAPRQAAVADTYAWMLLQGGQTAQALPLLKGAAAAMPTNTEVRYHYAAALAKSGDTAGAREQITDALRDPTPFPGRDEAEKLAATLAAK